MRESAYQTELIKKIEHRLPGCFVLVNDPQRCQGILDLTIFHGPFWAMLEVKAYATAQHQPNQDYYVDLFNRMSFAAFIYPENEEDVLNALQSASRTIGQACLFES